MILRFGFSTILGTPFVFRRLVLLALIATGTALHRDGRRFASATDDVAFSQEMRHDLHVIFPMRACLLLFYGGNQSSGQDDSR